MRSRFGNMLSFFCSRKFHGTHGGVRCNSSLNLSRRLVQRKKAALQGGSKVLRCSVLTAGYKYVEGRITEGLPAVEVTVKSRALPFQAGIVEGWHPSSHRKAFWEEVLE